MTKVLYVKYNSMRKPDYQIKTSIISDNDEIYVLKSPLNSNAITHIFNMEKNYEKLQNNYGCIKLVSYKREGNGIKFPFISGKQLLDTRNIENYNVNEIVNMVNGVLEIIFNKGNNPVHKFVMSSQFSDMFPGYEPIDEYSFNVSNLDSIISNFIRVDEDIYCIDYEWVYDFDIPIDFLKFRTLFYFYQENRYVLEDRISSQEFLEKFGYDDEHINLYMGMDLCFQYNVHGEEHIYDYLSRYKKDIEELKTIKNLVVLKDNHISNLENEKEFLKEKLSLKDNHINNLQSKKKALEELVVVKDGHIDNLSIAVKKQQDYIFKLRRAIKNPIYGGYAIAKKCTNKVKSKINSVSNDKYKKKCEEKYGHLIRQSMNDNYEDWIKKVEEGYESGEDFLYNPKISIIVPVYNVLDRHLVPCIESVINQTYENWELCIADDASTWDNVKITLEKYANNPKIKIVFREENGHISECTNTALSQATGDFVAFLDCDDVLRPNALYEVVKLLNENGDLDFIYSDEDKIDDNGKNRHMPHFKPDWSPDTLMAHMYTCHFGVYRKSMVDKVGGIRKGYEGAQDYDFTLRFTEQTNRIGHIPKILYHWRVREESTAGGADAKPYVIEATKKCKEEALLRRGIAADVVRIGESTLFRIDYKVVDLPKVSIIIPSKDNYDILERCIDSIYNKTSYNNYEIVLIDNGSNDENRCKYSQLALKHGFKYVYDEMEFNFSKMCNLGTINSDGEYYLFLNDDTEIIMSHWLDRMLGHAQQKHVGAVGAKLLYPNNRSIQHTGVINIKNGPSHAFSGKSDDCIYYFGRNKMEYNYLAVTAACLLVSADKFKEVGGFDEDLAVAYNDVDLCFKLVEHGYYNVVRTDVELLHYESISRGFDLVDEKKRKRLENELKFLYSKHPKFDGYDPFYNVNLTQDKDDFSYNYSTDYEEYDDIESFDFVSRNDIVQSDKVKANVDIVSITNSIYIEGWGYIEGYKKNNMTDIKVILKNDSKGYIISTRKRYRPDLEKNLRESTNIEFVGFKLEVSNDDIEEGTYEICVVCRDKCCNTGKMIEL